MQKRKRGKEKENEGGRIKTRLKIADEKVTVLQVASENIVL